MTERKLPRNAQNLKARLQFRISREPVVHVASNDQPNDVGDNVGLPSEPGARILFVIARDPRTIFASWNIDWVSLFEKIVPVNRQVQLRVYSANGLEKTVAVEPMAAMHYVTTSGAHSSYRVEIGYYQPADVWHSVAMSHEIAMPPDASAQIADVDLATIPFHVAFQQLIDLFTPPSQAALAAVISQFQKRVLARKAPKLLSVRNKKILRELGVSVSDIKALWRAFDHPETETLVRRTGDLAGFGATSPSRGFSADWPSARS
jgi:hypothetical protein